MGLFGSKNKSKVTDQPLVHGKVFNFIKVDSINGKEMNEYYWEYSKHKSKGLLAGKVEMIFLEPGNYSFIAHGRTYQTTPTSVNITIEAGENYILGAYDGGLYLDPYDYYDE